MSFSVFELDGNARLGSLKTAHGEIKTPTTFPVHNLGADGGWNTPKYWQIFPDINTAMFNAYNLLRNLHNVRGKITAAGGVHQLVDFPGAAFIDSGGFNALSESINPDQEQIFRIQREAGADIASTLDYPFKIKSDLAIPEKIEKSVENAKKVKKEECNDKMLLYASAHGDDPLVVRNVLRHLSKFKTFDGYALGSLQPIRSDFSLVIDIVISARSAVPNEPLHVYGLGGPLTIPLLAYLGVDSTDSSSFIICGGYRVYFVPGRSKTSMENLSRLQELPCNCPVCASKTIKELRGNRSLLALHNIWAIWQELKQVRFAITEHRLESYLKERYSSTPVMKMAFEYARRRVKHLF